MISSTGIESVAFVIPKSSKAKNRFANQMDQESECVIEQSLGTQLFLRSRNGRHFFWVSIHNDAHWEVDF
jgi:hypothetical protein